MPDRDFEHPSSPRRPRHPRARLLLTTAAVGLLGVMLSGFVLPNNTPFDSTHIERDKVPDHSETFPLNARLHIDLALPEKAPPLSTTSLVPTAGQKGVTHTVEVNRGDTLSNILASFGVAGELPAVLKATVQFHALNRIQPGETLTLVIDRDRLERLSYHAQNAIADLNLTRTPDGFEASSVQHRYEHRLFHAAGKIRSSLFMDGQRAGLSDRLVMQLADIFGWDIDFALDLRPGDHFTVVYDTLYENGARVREGNIVAAEFVNQGHHFRALRYTTPDGRTDYYTPDGHSLRKAFLRTPVQFTRISSRFNLHRRHPILDRIRAHKGVDYAAPIGTPVRAAGDGKLIFKGWKGGYGRFIVLQHGQGYSTAYGHLSRFATKMRTGTRVRQGQIIGYVGQSGLATGPHLHYEFRVNGIHRDPLKIRLPAARPLNARYLTDFVSHTSPLLAQIDSYRRAFITRAKDT